VLPATSRDTDLPFTVIAIFIHFLPIRSLYFYS
jgi:hypothetical protein